MSLLSKLTELRQHQRSPCQRSATIYHNNTVSTATVVDISEGGCRLALADVAQFRLGDPVAGCALSIRVGSNLLTAHLVWWNEDGSHIGCRFPQALPALQLQAICQGK